MLICFTSNMFVLRAQQFWIQWVGSIILRVWIQWVRSIIFRNLLDAAYPSYPAVWWIQWGIVSKGIRVGDSKTVPWRL